MIAVLPDLRRDRRAGAGLLVVARLVQGLPLGGEYGASATYMSEMAGRKRRGFWSSFQYVTLIGGQLIALARAAGAAAVAAEADSTPGAGASPSRSAACWRSSSSGSAAG